MARYTHPVMYTVELLMPKGIRAIWEFGGDETGDFQARALYKQLTERKGVMWAATKNIEIDGEDIHGVNLVAWDMHPTRDDATGMLLAQLGWSKD